MFSSSAKYKTDPFMIGSLFCPFLALRMFARLVHIISLTPSHQLGTSLSASLIPLSHKHLNEYLLCWLFYGLAALLSHNADMSCSSKLAAELCEVVLVPGVYEVTR